MYIVSLTSWKKRIKYVYNVINNLLNGTQIPDKIILILSFDEFINKEKDLPENLINLQNNIFKILWIKENTTTYKKIIPIINLYPDDYIITIDDDVNFPNNFIENVINDININNNKPITYGDYKWWGKLYSHHGAFSVISKKYTGEYINELYNYVINDSRFEKLPHFVDVLITYSSLLNGYTYILGYQCMKPYLFQTETADSQINTLQYEEDIFMYHKLIQEFIENKYGIIFTKEKP